MNLDMVGLVKETKLDWPEKEEDKQICVSK